MASSVLQWAIAEALELLESFRLSSGFNEACVSAFGKEISSEAYLAALAALPPVSVVADTTLPIAHGAYASNPPRILLAESLLTGPPGLLKDVLLEEIGHYLDDRFNPSDSPGDEGAIWAALVQGRSLTAAQLKVLKQEVDHGLVILAGQQVPVELAVVAPLPNLAVDDYFNLPSRLIPGDTVSVSWRALNTGDAATPVSPFEDPAWVDSIYFSTDTELDPSDVLLGSKPFFGSPAYSGNPLPGIGDPTNFYFNYTFAFDHLRIPTDLLSNSGYLLLKLDSNNSITESNEYDNVLASTAISIGPADINLTPTNLEVTTQNLTWGGDYNFHYTLVNIGLDDTTTQWVDSLYFSTDATFDESDRSLTFWTLGRPEGQPVLASGMSNTFYLGSSLPENQPTQHGYFFLKTNPDADQIETNYTDNISAPIPVYIEADDLPDLSVSFDVETPAETLLSSQPLQLSWTVTNAGGTAAAPFWYDQLWFSPDPTFDDADLNDIDNDIPGPSFKIDASTIGYWPLFNGWAYTYNADNLSVPNDISGSGYFYVKTDATGLLPEQAELNNNTTGLPVTINQPDVNLVADPYSFSVFNQGQADGIGFTAAADLNIIQQFYTGSAINFSWAVFNSGSVATTATTWSDRVLFSRDQSISADDVVIAERSSGFSFEYPLQGNFPENPGSYYSVEGDPNLQYTIPSDLVGSGYLLLQVDAFDNQYETVETDNHIPLLVEFLAPPSVNLTATGVEIRLLSNPEEIYSGPLTWGQRISLGWNVAVSGDSPTWNYYNDTIVYSSDSIFGNSDDITIVDNVEYSYHEASSSYGVTTEITLPNIGQASGLGYLLFKTDSYNNQPESIEEDNLFSLPVAINAVDLLADSVTAVDSQSNALGSIEFGQPFTISWTTTNADLGTVNRTWNDRIYLSRDNILSADDIIIATRSESRSLSAGGSYTDSATATIDFNAPLPTDTSGYVSESEPNDSIAQALNLQQNFLPTGATNSYLVKAKGSISTSYEGDYYRIYAGPSDQLRLYMYGFDTYLYFYDRNGTLLRQDDDGGGGLNSLINYTFPATAYAGEYYFRSAGYSSRTGNYGLDVTLTTSQPILTGNLTPGDYYLLLKTDINNSVPESNESNNVVATISPLALTALSRADLTISGLVPAQEIKINSSFSVSWTVTNISSTDTARSGWFDSVYLSSDDILDAGDLTLASVARTSGAPDLEPGGSYSVTTNLTLPTGQSGNRYLIFAADSTNNRLESNESNNQSVIAIDIVAPDLVVSSATAPATASWSESIALSWSVANQGNGVASADWYDRIVLSGDQIFGNNDDTYLTEVWQGSLTPLSAGASYNRTLNVTLPSASIGNQYLLIKTDNYNYEAELNDNNNVFTLPINILAPDLYISSASAPSSAALNESISLSWTVTNQGIGTAPADWYDRVVISTDQIFGNSDDTLLTEVWQGSYTPLASGGSYTRTLNGTVPITATGERFLLFKADNYNYQVETNENNNVFSHAINIVAPDLTVSSASAPSSAALNESISLSWTVTNQGIGTAAADWYDRVVISTDQIFGNSDDTLLTEVWQGSYTPLASGGSYTRTLNGTVPITATGERFLLFKADNYNYQGETDENNNIFSHAINIVAPDLTVSSASAPSSAALNESISLSWTVTNQGIGTAAADWYDRVVISTDQIFGNSDDTLLTEVWQGSYTPLASGGSYTRTLNGTVPITATGERFLLFKADNYNYQGETDENNNIFSHAINIVAPDLTVSSASAPSSAALNESISLSWTVTNQGIGTAAADWYDRVVISTDQIFGNSDDTYLTEVWQGSFTPLAAGASYSRTINVTLPSTTTGDRYLLFKADNYNYQGEADENNNVYFVPINISASDLQITATNAPPTAILGETVELTWIVTNNGTGAASQDWYDRVYLSNNQTLDGGDVQVTSELIGSQTPLAAGASYTISKNVTLPSFTLGNQYLIFVADRDNYQGEISENNNLAAVAISLTAPDLIVSNASVPATGTVGKSIEVSWTVQNQGTSAAPTDWYDRIYLSNDTIFDANTDTYITQELISTQTPLAAGASYSTTRNINLPNFATGNRYLIFVADGSGSQGETNESNNTRAAAINLNAPDLIVTDITAPVESLSGQPIEINWTVKNQGAVTAGGTWYDYVSLLNTTTNSTQYVGVFEYSGSLAAGASLNRTQSYSVPLSLTGNYRVVVTTDYYGQIAEGTQNESNNTSTDDRSISLQLAPVPNLQVTGVTAPSTAFSSQETVVQWTVKNVGTGATNAPVWYDRVYLSLDSTYDNTDTYLGQAVNPSYLNPDDSYSNSLTVSLPRGIDGNYHFLVQADAYNYVAEVGNEGDNWGSGGPTDVNLTPPPDLQVSAVNAPNGAFSGQPMNLSWTVTNAGTGRTLETAWYDRVLMSADATLDAGDRILGTFYHSGALNAGANYTASATVNLPIGVAGSFFFFVQSDIYNNVYEHVFENNNSGYDTTATNITLTPPPDLEFESLTMPNNARSGSNLNISYRVTNFGATETPNNYWTDTFYLSSDNQLNTATDINLGSSGQYGILYPGDGYDRTANFALPNTLTGNYYVFGVTDSGDQLFELDNVNNITQSINQVQIVSQPADLVVTGAVIPTTGEAGKAISVQWTVSNQGTGDTIVNSWSDRLVVSNDYVLGDADDLTIASFTRTGLLAPNGSYSWSESVILPFALEGNYQLFVVTDSVNSVYEGGNEANNASSAFPLTISRDTPDLQVTSITLPNTVTSGQPLTLNWTVANLGVGRTNSNYWYDRVYLSLDQNVSNDDINLGSVYRAGALDQSASYSTTGTFSLPVNLNSSYYVLVQTDRDNNVIEGTFENNNVLASDSSSGGGSGIGSLPMTPAPSADLSVTAVGAPEQGIAGQSLSLTWTVVNNDANSGQNWYDAVYLSRDQVFDRNSDIYLGYRTHTGGLTAGDSYTATQSFNIPRGLGGRFYAFVVTDGGNAVYERLGEINNVNYDGFSTEIILPPPVDLVVGTITIPVNGTPGQNASISYTVNNQSTNEAIGTWEDIIYLSSDNQWDVNDAFFERVSQTGPVAGGGSYSKTVDSTLPGVATGDYYVIVRSDIRNYIPESNEANNIKASLDDFAVNVESLELGTPTTGTLGQGQAVYYRFDVGAGETLRLKLDSASTTAANELYLRYGEVPTRSAFDLGFSAALSPDQEIVIPSTRGGTYYLLAYGGNVPGGSANYNIEADILDFSISSLGTTLGSNKGQTTVRISGAKFTGNDIVNLRAADGTLRQASKVWWKDSTELWATLDLQGLTTGAYDVKVNHGSQAVILDDAFTVSNGAIGNLTVNIGAPSALRPGQSGIVTVNYANSGETDIVAPLLTLVAENANLRLPEKTESVGSSLQFLGINSEGPAGIIAPGASGSFSLLFNPTVDNGSVSFSVSQAAKDQIIDWSSLKNQARPSNISNDAWDEIWENFITSVGNQAGTYQDILADNANHLSQLGEYTNDAIRLLGFELLQVSNSLVESNIGQSVNERFSTSTFGRAGVNDWDIKLIPDVNGDITLFFGTFPRFFSKQNDSSYQGQLSDNATLIQDNGIYQLREANGTLITFRLDGKLDYIEDINQNRITASYTEGKLTRLVHSDSNYIEFSYNAQGLASQTTDQDNWTTTYQYDTNGEYLLSITTPEGITSYTYETNLSSGSKHALKSVSFSDNSGLFYEYDEQGRLVKKSLDGNAEPITYSYDSSGGVTVSDASGAVSKLLYNDRGTLGRLEDPLKRITQYQYDNNGNITKLTAADNTVATFTYDNQGNIISSINALGQQIKYTYETNFNQLANVRDQRGNPLNYSYDNQGNLQQITYADGSKETFSYDATGNLTDAANRRNQNIIYTYNSDGLLTRKDFADGTSATYIYDSRGNLLSATDADSSVTYTYDSVDRRTKVSYGADRFLEFTYDSAGRRSQMVDQDGFTTNYSYDTLGKLKSLTDDTGANIISYTYDNVGRLSREDNGNGTYTTYGYDLAGQMLSLVNYEADGIVNSRFDYTYDNAGRRTSTTTLEGTTNYGYDSIGQLTLANLPNGRIIEYQYDAAGNRIKVKDSGVETAYTTNNLNQYTNVGAATYTYDTDGNLIAKTQDVNIWTYGYDSENRLISAVTPEGTWSYEYDALGNRIASILNGQRTEYLLDPTGLGNVVGEYGGNGIIIARYMHGLGLVSRVDGTNAASYYDADAIGSIVGLTGANGDYLNQYSYLPFGESLSTIEAVSNPFEYVGQWGVMREGNSLDFMGARFYDSLTGKFTSSDPLGMSAGDPNLYRYVFNNPNSYIDQSGTIFWIPVAAGAGALIGAGLSAATYVTTQVITGQDITLGGVAGSLVSGAAYGAVIGGTGGLALPGVATAAAVAGMVGVGAATNSAGYLVQTGIDGGFSGAGLAETAIIGGITGPLPWFMPGFRPSNWLQSRPNKLLWPLLSGQNVRGSAIWKALGITSAAGLTANGLNSYLGLDNQSLLAKFLSLIIRPSDPNDIVGPAGFGDEKWITASSTLPYTIRFENQASATAPAQTVTVTHPLDSDLDLRTFRLGSFGWSGLTFNVPENRSFYNQRVDLTEQLGFLVDVFAGIDIQKGEAFWTLTTIDPETGETPENPLIGFLPPNNEDGVGDGFVTYSIRPGRTAETGDVIDAVATIIFDTEEPISTPPIFNTLDVDKPSSQVNDLPATTATPEFLVSWSGADVGAALASYTVYVSDNGGPYLPWLQDTTLTESNYAGSPGHLYRFISVAKDNAGNIQVLPQEAQATTFIQGEVNQPPSAVALTNVTAALAENSSTASRIKLADIAISDDALGSNSIALSGVDAAAFEVEGTVLYLKAGTSLDYESKTSYAVTVSVNDATLSGSSPVSTAYSLSITDVNEAPTAVALTNVTTALAENSSTASRIKLADIAISDDALGTNSIVLSGADAAAFEVDGTDLYLKAGISLDYETKPSYAVTVSVSDAMLSGSSPVSTAYSLSITDVNDAPTAVALNNVTTALAENTSTASRIKVADIAISDDALGSNTIALSGADAAAFEVEGTVLYLKAGTSLDYETKAAYAVTVSVSDATLSGSSPESTAYSLSITDVDETPSLTVLSTSTFTEDSPAHGSGAVVAGFSTTNALAVALSDTLHYALGSGADAGKVLLTAAGLALVNAGSDLPAFLLTPSNGAISGPAVSVDPLVLPTNDGPASFAISGTPAVGNTLAVTQLSPDPDGSGTAPGITWQTSAAGDSWSVVGTSSSYQLSSADEGKQLRALVSYSDGQGFAESVTTSPLTVPLLPTLAIAAPITSLLEGNIGSTPFGFTITRTGDLTDESRVTWAVTGSGANPATAADFAGGAFPSGTAVFAPGQDTVSLAVNVVGDGSLEADEGFRIELNSPIGAHLSATTSTGLLQILNDDQPAPTYSFVATPQTVYEGGTLHIAITTTNVVAGSSLWWQLSGSGITASDFSDGQLAGSTLIGSDGRAAFTKTIAADALVEPDETLEVRFYSDAARSQSVGSSLAVTLKEPSVGFVTDGNDVITGTAAAELITGVPVPGLRGKGSVDRLTGGAGADIFALGDALGIYYDDGTTGLGTTDLAVITDFTAQDRIQMFGSSSGYRLVSGRYSGIAGVRIDALSTASGIMPEAIGFVQGATMATLSLTNPNQFLYI